MGMWVTKGGRIMGPAPVGCPCYFCAAAQPGACILLCSLFSVLPPLFQVSRWEKNVWFVRGEAFHLFSWAFMWRHARLYYRDFLSLHLSKSDSFFKIHLNAASSLSPLTVTAHSPFWPNQSAGLTQTDLAASSEHSLFSSTLLTYIFWESTPCQALLWALRTQQYTKQTKTSALLNQVK